MLAYLNVKRSLARDYGIPMALGMFLMENLRQRKITLNEATRLVALLQKSKRWNLILTLEIMLPSASKPMAGFLKTLLQMVNLK